MQLINASRLHGYHHATLDTQTMAEPTHIPDLDLAHYHFSVTALDNEFSTESPQTRKK